MSAQAALCIFAISDVDPRNISVLREANLMTRRYAERASRSQIRIQGVGGSTIYLAEVDPILTISITGWMQARGGLTNSHPGTVISWDMIENWRNNQGRQDVDHFGWDVAQPAARQFIVRDPEFTRIPGGLAEISLQLALECTAVGGSAGPGVGGGVDNPPDTTPAGPLVLRIITVYTDKGSWQWTSYEEHPDLDKLFGTRNWNEGTGSRPISYTLPDHPGAAIGTPPINVLGVNVQAASGDGSATGGLWLAGSAAEVSAGGGTLKSDGLNVFVFTPFDEDGDASGINSWLVTGSYANETAALASIGKTAADFASIYKKTPAGGVEWPKDEGHLSGGDPISWFLHGAPRY